MVQILPRSPTLAETLGGGLAQGFSQGVSSGLELLAKERLEKINRANKQKDALELLKSLPGFESTDQQPISPGGEDAIDTTVREQTPSGGFDESEKLRLKLAALGGPDELNKVYGDIQKDRADRTFRERKFAENKRQFAVKETAPYRSEVNKALRAAKQSQLALEGIKAASKGKLTNPLAAALLRKLPIDASALLTKDTLAIEKLTTTLLAENLKKLGGKITNLEVETFLKGVPNINQTQEGRDLIIRNMELMQIQPDILRGEAARAIIKENENHPPEDLEDRVEERVAPELEKLGKQIRNGFAQAEALAKGDVGKTTEERIDEKRKKQLRKKAGPGRIAVISPEGQEGSISEEKLDEYIQKNYTIL